MVTKIKRWVWLLTLLFAALLFIFAMLLRNSAPGPDEQEILGVGLGQWEMDDEPVFISGQRLRCQPIVDEAVAFRSRCTVDLNGEDLTILAARNGPESHHMLGGQCSATFGDESLACNIGSRHVHIHWFAFVQQPEGLDAAALSQIQRRYFWENLPQPFYMSLIILIAGITAVLAVTHLILLLWTHTRHPVGLSMLGALPVGFIFFYIGLISAFWIMYGYID